MTKMELLYHVRKKKNGSPYIELENILFSVGVMMTYNNIGGRSVTSRKRVTAT